MQLTNCTFYCMDGSTLSIIRCVASVFHYAMKSMTIGRRKTPDLCVMYIGVHIDVASSDSWTTWLHFRSEVSPIRKWCETYETSEVYIHMLLKRTKEQKIFLAINFYQWWQETDVRDDNISICIFTLNQYPNTRLKDLNNFLI